MYKRQVSSGLKTFEEIFGAGGFSEWIDVRNVHLIQKQIYDEAGFLWHEGDKNILIRAIKDNITEHDTYPYEIIKFPGGMFLVATADENDRDDLEETVSLSLIHISMCIRDSLKVIIILYFRTRAP